MVVWFGLQVLHNCSSTFLHRELQNLQDFDIRQQLKMSMLLWVKRYGHFILRSSMEDAGIWFMWVHWRLYVVSMRSITSTFCPPSNWGHPPVIFSMWVIAYWSSEVKPPAMRIPVLVMSAKLFRYCLTMFWQTVRHWERVGFLLYFLISSTSIQIIWRCHLGEGLWPFVKLFLGAFCPMVPQIHQATLHLVEVYRWHLLVAGVVLSWNMWRSWWVRTKWMRMKSLDD